MPTTQYLDVPGGRIAYDVRGEGPLVVLAPGMADTREAYRFLAPLIADAGFTVARADLRGHGASDTGWASSSRTDTAQDLLALVRELGGAQNPSVIVGQSFSGGSATIAAAIAPELVRGIVEIGPFTRPPGFNLGAFLRNDHDYRRGALHLAAFALTGRVKSWLKYLDVAYPGRKPGDWDTWRASLAKNLSEPGRVAAVRGMINSSPKDAAAQLANVRCPALIVMGSIDSDFADPQGEAEGIVAALPQGLGHYVMIEGAGHYPHAQFPEEVAAAVVDFLKGLPGAQGGN